MKSNIDRLCKRLTRIQTMLQATEGFEDWYFEEIDGLTEDLAAGVKDGFNWHGRRLPRIQVKKAFQNPREREIPGQPMV